MSEQRRLTHVTQLRLGPGHVAFLSEASRLSGQRQTALLRAFIEQAMRAGAERLGREDEFDVRDEADHLGEDPTWAAAIARGFVDEDGGALSEAAIEAIEADQDRQ